MSTVARVSQLAIVTIQVLAFMIALVVPSLATPSTGRSEVPAGPYLPDVASGDLATMLGYLPDLPLGKDAAMVTYADFAREAATLGIEPPRGPKDTAGQEQWKAMAVQLDLPQTMRYWAFPDWREAFGFDVYQVAQVVEYYAGSGLGLTVLRGTFDPAELRAAWKRQGYQSINLGDGDAYAVRDDYEIDVTDPAGKMAMAYLNVVAIAEDGALVVSSTRDGVRQALAVIAGQAPSFADRFDVAPLVRTAPSSLVSALLVHGELLQAAPDPFAALLEDEPLEDFATRAAAEQTEARQLRPVVTALLGRTMGVVAGDPSTASPAAALGSSPTQLVASLITISPDAAEAGAGVIDERLATQRAASGTGKDVEGRTWAELFPQRMVRAVPGEPVILIEVDPAPGVSPFILRNLPFRRAPGFLAWDW